MTTLVVPPPSPEYLATLTELATADFNALDRPDEHPDEYLPIVDDYVRAVLAVAALLDVARPDWFRVVDLDDLELDSTNRCVLGQVYAADARETHHVDGFSYGFATLIRPRFGDVDRLQLGVCSVAPRSVWVAEVARRRELAGDTAIVVTT